MKVIGLCGGSGSGKGCVAELFLRLGIPSVDTDRIYREMTRKAGPCLDELADAFGLDILNPDGSLDRKRLANLVFSGEGSADRLIELNKITHKYILAEVERLILDYEAKGNRAVLIDAPVLFESGFDKRCDEIICVVADRETRLKRIMARDGITRADAERRVASQISDDELISRCNYVIRNDGDLGSLYAEVNKLKNKLLI